MIVQISTRGSFGPALPIATRGIGGGRVASSAVLQMTVLYKFLTVSGYFPEVNEQSNQTLRFSFYDEGNSAAIPDLVSYQIHDIISGTEIKASTIILPSSFEVSIDITSNENRILTSTNKFEQRTVTLIFTYASGTKQGTEEVRYLVKNLTNVS